MIITIISPDKISMAMYSDYLKKELPLRIKKQVEVVDQNVIYSQEVIQQFYQILKDKSDACWVVKFKVKTNTKLDSLPVFLLEDSDAMVKMGLYSNDPEIIKGADLLDEVSKRFSARSKIIDQAG